MASPQQRRKARCRALEFLYGLEFTKYEWRDAAEHFWKTFATKDAVREYAETLVEGVVAHCDDLDRQIDAALTSWTPERVGRVERNVLRIALFELLHCEDVAPKVAINEAIEIARMYGADEAPGFVNAVLDRLKDSEPKESTP